MSANTEQILALMEGMTAEQLTAIAEQAKKKKKNAKKEKELAREKMYKEMINNWEAMEFCPEITALTNDERIVLLCECYGLKVAHRRQGRHQERPLGDASTRPNGQYSNIVRDCEERFKYEVMGKAWRGRKIWEGKGKSKVFKGVEFDLQKAMKVVWGKLTAQQKKHFHHKFSNEWYKVGDNVHEVNAPTERTNSKAFIAWWNEHITRVGGKWVFEGEYDVEKDFMKYYDIAVNGGGGAKPAEKPAPKKTKTKQKTEKKPVASKTAPKPAEKPVASKTAPKKTEKKKRRTKKEMAEAKAMGMEDMDAGKKNVADMFEEEDLRVFTDGEEE